MNSSGEHYSRLRYYVLIRQLTFSIGTLVCLSLDDLIFRSLIVVQMAACQDSMREIQQPRWSKLHCLRSTKDNHKHTGIVQNSLSIRNVPEGPFCLERWSEREEEACDLLLLVVPNE